MDNNGLIKQIKDNIPLVYEAGYNKCLKENPPGATEEELQEKYEEGYNSGHEEGIKEGKQAEYNAFWDVYQDNGNRTNYERAFAGIGWNDITFKPKYKVNVSASAYMTFAATHITEINRETVDFSRAIKFTYTFYYPNRLEKIEVDLSSATKISDLFYNSNATADRDKYGNLADVKLFNINEKCTFTRPFPTPFPKLTNFFVSGVIGSDFDIKNLTLISKDNIINVINCLSTATSGLTVTLSQTAVNNAFTTEEWSALEATKSNWNISLV